MANINEITKAFAYSDTPHLILACDSPYPVVGVNPAFCAWVNASAEMLLQQSIFSAPNTFINLTGLKKTKVIQLIEEVINSKSAYKLKLNPSILTNEIDFYRPEGYLLEIYPILEKTEVTNLVLKVETVSSAIPLETVLPNCCNLEGLSTSQLLPLILDSLANVIFVLDVESPGSYKYAYVNRAFQITTGLPVSKVIGSYVQEIIPEPSLSRVLEKYQEALHLQQLVTWTEISDYPNGQKTGEVVVVPILDPECNCWRLVGMVHDITAHVEAEAKQQCLAQDLYHQNRDLQQFTYMVSHNLRSPVASAVGLIGILSMADKTSKEFDISLGYLKESVNRLDEILKDINLILSIRDRREILKIESVSLYDVCQQVLADLAETLHQCGGQVYLNIDKDVLVPAYQAYLYSIFYNLISNAIKYRSDKRPLQVNIEVVKKPEDGTRITITDNGTGFDLNKAGNQVFKLYSRFHTKIEGKGIGLFLVKTHVEVMGGQVEVISQVDKGTIFTIDLRQNQLENIHN